MPWYRKMLRPDYFIKMSIGTAKITQQIIHPGLFNCDVNRGTLVSSCSSSVFSQAQPLGFSVLSCKLGTFMMWKRGFRIRKKQHFECWSSWYFYSSYNYCYDVLFLIIRRNSILISFLLSYLSIYPRILESLGL